MRKLPELDMTGDTHYLVLGIPETATLAEIKHAYRALMRQIHPDRFPNASPYWKLSVEERSKKVIEAYCVVSDSTQRSSYDQQLAQYRRRYASAPQPKSPTTTPPRKAATTSRPHSYPSPPNPRPKMESVQMGLLRFFVGFLILATLFSGIFDFPSLFQTDPDPPPTTFPLTRSR
jgi:curved DNA-binding protein CbpA